MVYDRSSLPNRKKETQQVRTVEEFDTCLDPFLVAVGVWAHEEEAALVVEGLPGGGDGDADAVEMGEG